jgi:hypothetical protein
VKTHRFEGYWISDGVYESIAIQKQLGTKQDWLQSDSQVFCVWNCLDLIGTGSQIIWHECNPGAIQNKTGVIAVSFSSTGFVKSQGTRHQMPCMETLQFRSNSENKTGSHCTTGFLSIEYVKSAHKLCKERTHLLWANLQ